MACRGILFAGPGLQSHPVSVCNISTACGIPIILVFGRSINTIKLSPLCSVLNTLIKSMNYWSYQRTYNDSSLLVKGGHCVGDCRLLCKVVFRLFTHGGHRWKRIQFLNEATLSRKSWVKPTKSRKCGKGYVFIIYINQVRLKLSIV